MHLPLTRSVPSSPRVTSCEPVTAHEVLTGVLPFSARHLPATPEVIGAAGICQAWFVAPLQEATVSWAPFVGMPCTHRPEDALMISPSMPVRIHCSPVVPLQV